MRLTLRNLLAYLDGILEPEDAQDIARKIEDSGYATDLMHRIRDLTRRMRLAAPSVSARGPGLDPNTVAEYLDNMLSPDRVVDFEKVCLESDIHLAEVAACHQILSLVLGEPMEIAPEARQRMYQIGEEAVSPAPAGPPPIPTSPPPVPEGEKTGLRVKPTIPDYLREPRKKRRWLVRLGAGVGALCVVAVLLAPFGQWEPGTPLGDLLVRWHLIQDRRQMAETPKKGTPSEESPPPASAEKAESPPAESTSTAPAPAEAPPEKNGDNENPVPSTKQELSPEQPAPESPPGAAPPAGEPLPPPSTDGTPVLPGTPPAGAAVPPSLPDGHPETPEPAAAVPAPGPAAPPVAPADLRMGRLMSDDQILLTKPEGTASWQRVAPRGTLGPQQSLLSLPTYRPELALSSGLTLQLVGGTDVELLPAAPPDLPGLKIHFGRVVMMPLANPGVKLRLVLPNRSGVLSFQDADAVAAIEVRRVVPPGADPEGGQARYVAQLLIPAGRIGWEEPGQKPLECTAPGRFLLEDQAAPRRVEKGQFPKWLTEEAGGELERQASQVLVKEWKLNVPAKQNLLEFSEHRKKEVCWLAVRCLGYLGYFDPLVAALGNTAFNDLERDANIRELRQAVVRDAAAAAAVRQALEKQYGPLALDLYRMLWGYTNQDLARGEDARLVDFLNHENLAVRVLSFWNLKELTGLGLYYRPEYPEGKRQQPLQAWRQRRDAGEIRIKTPELKPGNAVKETTPPPPGEREL